MLGPPGAQALATGYFPQLLDLDLKKNFIGDAGLANFGAALFSGPNKKRRGCFPNLLKIDLSIISIL